MTTTSGPETTPVHVLYECGCCGCLHPWNFCGDCRDNESRYGAVEDYCERNGLAEFGPDGRLQVEVRFMEDRIADDLGEVIEGHNDPEHDHPGPECRYIGFGIWSCGITDES